MVLLRCRPQSLRSHIPLPQRTDRIEESSSDDDDDDTIDNLSEVTRLLVAVFSALFRSYIEASVGEWVA